ncbi:MAG: hypothetical protein CYPHOPRED_003439 [Cyphobasidiales sp. Tagirdzhanova-0007]|nr:MAG: hypothetical protein CYPHOPRED_003439 [Cyphobasidiales sp. Tagirdzhanova-0007]
MHVFVTGGSGLVGSSLLPLLVKAGHKVTALARSDAAADKLSSLGATPIKGSHTDLEVLGRAASEADAVIHLAFNHNVMAKPGGMLQACEEDRAAISAMCEPLSGTGKTYLGTSGTFGSDGPDEKSVKMPNAHSPRYLSEELVIKYADKNIRTLIVRLPPVVHGPGYEHPFVATQVAVAKKIGFAAYVGDGSQVWPSVHVKDATELYLLALSKEPSGVFLHGVQEEGISTKDLTSFIAGKLSLEAKSVTLEEAMKDYGFVGGLMSMGNKATTEYTRKWTGWEPKEYGLFVEMQNYAY